MQGYDEAQKADGRPPQCPWGLGEGITPPVLDSGPVTWARDASVNPTAWPIMGDSGSSAAAGDFFMPDVRFDSVQSMLLGLDPAVGYGLG